MGRMLRITHVEVAFKRQECSHKPVIARFELLSGGQLLILRLPTQLISVD